MRAVADALFVLPVLPRLAARYAALIELNADDAAVAAWSALVLGGNVIAALHASEVSHELSFATPLMAQHLCLITADLGPLAGTAALLFGRSALARRRTRA